MFGVVKSRPAEQSKVQMKSENKNRSTPSLAMYCVAQIGGVKQSKVF